VPGRNRLCHQEGDARHRLPGKKESMAFNRPYNASDSWNEDRFSQPGNPGAYPPPPEYFSAQSTSNPAYPPAPDYFRADASVGRMSQPLRPDQFRADYVDETPTNQLTDIRYDQQKKRTWAKAGGGAGVGILGVLLKFGGAILAGLKFLAIYLKFGYASISILISLAIYAAIFGWRFALGIIFLLFLHEMGHVIVLRAKGVPASAPIFIPLMGAFVAMKGMPRNAKDEAEIGIAGPILGTVAALLCLVPFFTGSRIGLWPALAYFGFFINLFNLIPVTPLDGGRIVGAISRKAWIVGLLLLLGVFFYDLAVTHYFNLFLLMILLLSASQVYQQFKRGNQAGSYYQVPLATRIGIGVAYFGLAAFLVVMMAYAQSLIPLAVGQ
jgi:Zn-dependent protease